MPVKGVFGGVERRLFPAVLVEWREVAAVAGLIQQVTAHQDQVVEAAQDGDLHCEIYAAAERARLGEVPLIGDFWAVEVMQVVVAILDEMDIRGSRYS